MTDTATDGPISRTDIETKLREIRGEVDSGVQRAKVPALAIGVTALVGLVGLAYIMGRRRGKKTTTLVEVRRV